MNAETFPVFSYDNEHWQHVPEMSWDENAREATVKFRPDHDRVWIAHVAPYTHSRLLDLLARLGPGPSVRVEVIGQTVQGRNLHLLTVTDFNRPDAGKRTVWLQARQHAWETGTSFVMEGALEFITADDPRARALRERLIFKFMPMMDPDGCAGGKVRFNANGYDLNRHWNEVDLRRKEFLERMPEIWYVKKAIFACVDSGLPLDLMLNLHNTETAEYLETHANDTAIFQRMQRLFDALAANTSFDPSRELRASQGPNTTTNSLWDEKRIPVLLMEQRIGPGKKLGRRPTVEDRLNFGKQLITVMAETVLR